MSLCQSVIQVFNDNFVGLLHENQAVIAIFDVNKWLCVRIFQIDLPDLLDIPYNKVLRWPSSFGSIHQVMLKCPHVLEEHPDSSSEWVDGFVWLLK